MVSDSEAPSQNELKLPHGPSMRIASQTDVPAEDWIEPKPRKTLSPKQCPPTPQTPS